MWDTQTQTGLDNGGYGTLTGGTKLADTDGDGMPDVWEQQYGLNPNSAADAAGDFDGTGQTNVEKYVNTLLDGAYPLGASVSLAGKFTGVGITADGAAFTGGLDGQGRALSGFYLNGGLVAGGSAYALAAPGTANVMRTLGQTLMLPAGKYATLTFVGAAIRGAQTGQRFVVRYADGTTDTFTQSFSDWTAPQSFPGEATALTMAHRQAANGARTYAVTSLYQYAFTLKSAKTVRSVTVPNDPNVAILGMTLIPTPILFQAGGTYKLIPQNAPALALTVAADGSSVDVETVSGSGASSQQWTITDAGGGFYRLTPWSAQTKALDVPSTHNSTLVDSAASTGGAGQLWQITDLGNGLARISPKLDVAAGLNGALDVVGSHTTSGTRVVVYQIPAGAVGGSNEQWQFVRVR